MASGKQTSTKSSASIASKVAEVIKPNTESKGEGESKNKSSKVLPAGMKLALMPVSSAQSSFFNVKELSKQFSKCLEAATKSIVSLETVTEEAVSNALQAAFEATYSQTLEAVTSNGKKNKKNKRVKDPNAPKKALSNYMVYCMRYRSDVQDKNPGAKPTEISRILGAQWNALTAEQKAKYIDTTVSA
jgi:hypothetical protein